MPITTIPLAFNPDQRGPIISSASAPSKDARMVRCITTAVDNALTKTRSLYVEKVPGWATAQTPQAGSAGTAIYASANFGNRITAFGTTSTIYSADVSQGTLDAGVVTRFTEGGLNTQAVLLFNSTQGVGWYLPHDAIGSFTFTGDFTSGNANITNVSSLTGLYVGQKLSTAGAQVAAGARIASITPPSTVTMTANAGANGTGTTVTREGIAKITDADFPAAAGHMVELDGYAFATGQLSGSPAVFSTIAQSSQNDPSSWSASNRITPNIADKPVSLSIYRDMVVFFGVNTIQFFYNAGNASGSVLSQNDNLTVVGIGAVGGLGICPSVNLAGTIYWIGLVDGGTSGIYRFDGLTPVPVSIPAVIRELITVVTPSFSTQTNLAFDGFTLGGYNFLYVGSGDIGYLYCIETNQWTEAGFFSGGMRVHGSITVVPGTAVYGVRMTGTGGKVYVMGSTYQDDSAAYTMRLQTGRLALNQGKSFTIKAVRGINWDNQSSGNSTISTFTDDFTTEQLYGAVSLTDTKKEIKKQRFVKSGAVAFSITDSGNNEWRGEAIDVEWEQSVT